MDKETGEMIIVPGREDSYERLLEVEKQFAEKIIVNYRPFIYWLSTWRGDNQLYNKSADSSTTANILASCYGEIDRHNDFF